MVHKSALLLDATEYFFVCLARYPTLSNAQMSLERAASTSFSSDSFGRGSGGIGGSSFYPATSRASPTETLQTRGVTAWIRGSPYLVLLQEYLRVFVPISAPEASTITGQAPASSQRQQQQQLALESADYETLQLQRYCELFLHLAVAYWIDAALVLKADHAKLGLLRKQISGGMGGHAGNCLDMFLAVKFTQSKDSAEN